jgi:LPXTG-site transpeptidase (sortase) family protein
VAACCSCWLRRGCRWDVRPAVRTSAKHRSERGGHHRWVSALGLALVVGGFAAGGSLGPRTVAADAPGAPGASAATSGGTSRSPYVIEPRVTLETAPAGPAPAKPTVTGSPKATTAPAPAAGTGRPARLIVPSLGVDAPVVGIETQGAVLVPPDDPRTLGWWTGGARPGARFGGALITGHTVSSGGGAFDDLETLRRGDRVAVRTLRGVVRYRVTGVSIYRKASLARDAERLFSQDVPGRLVLVTCEDWTGEVYLSNVVVFAEPLSR